MKISDLDVGELVAAVSTAIAPIVFEGVDREVEPQVWRQRAQLNAEIMGRITAVLQCGDEVGPDIRELIDRCTDHMKVAFERSFAELLGPGGTLSEDHKL
ncbi:hypothetical protein [Pseudomonas sp. NY15374]|uniref:hypothetical protein n=1 Tax=Pseudomonas sp. NY15374 TaxID=3400357 RepID=UPI003A892BCC